MRPKVLVWLGLSKEPANFEFPYPVDYGIDSYEYFYAIEFHVIFCSALVIAAVLAADAMFIYFVQHVCSLFATIRFEIN